jgi:threonine synthase
MLSPEGAACVAAYRDSIASGKVRKDERAVIFNTAIGLRSPMGPIKRRIDGTSPINYAQL